MEDVKYTGHWFTFRCRSTIKYGPFAGKRCQQTRWHVGPHNHDRTFWGFDQ